MSCNLGNNQQRIGISLCDPCQTPHFSYFCSLLERCQSGRSCKLGKFVYRKVPGVRIPPSPPKQSKARWLERSARQQAFVCFEASPKRDHEIIPNSMVDEGRWRKKARWLERNGKQQALVWFETSSKDGENFG